MIAGITVVDVVRPSEKGLARLYDLGVIVGGSVAIVLCAQIAVGGPVPITGQTFAVLMIGALLGARRGVLCVLAYLAQGLAGLPVFAQGKAGVAALIGPTGGYLVGFVTAAWIVGTLAQRGWDRRVTTTIAAMILGNIALYACGLLWLACLAQFAGWSFGRTILAVGLYPFLPGEVVKVALAAILLPSGWRVIRHLQPDSPAGMRREGL